MTKTIALVTGGYSGEAVISYRSAATIFHHLNKEAYAIYPIHITPQAWFHPLENGEQAAVDKADFSISISSKKIMFDLVFIGLHGTPGEDGKLQGYFDMLGLRYTGCNAATSALTFNKRYTVAVAAMAGIAVAKSVHLVKGIPYNMETITAMRLPFFVKPNNGGSSIGMSKVTTAADLQPAIDKAFAEDSQVLVEEMITGREFTVGVFRTGGAVQVLPITEVVAHNTFFDFEAKYSGKATETTPAQIPAHWVTALEDAAATIYNVFNCGGVVRIDFIYNEEEGRPYMLEINTVPGQSDASVIPQQVRAKGWALGDFYSMLIEDALGLK